MKRSLTTNELSKVDPMDLIDYLIDTFPIILEDLSPVNCIDDMTNASNKMVELANVYSYLESLLAYFKIYVRNAKRELSKSEHEDMIDRRDIIAYMVEIIKQKHTSLSRAVTVYIENNKEIQMSSSRN